MPIRFGGFELDEGRRQLLLDGEPLPVAAKQLLLLQILIDRRPNAVPKRELYDRLWPDTFVSEANLAGLVKDLRTALGDDSRAPRFIRTIHGFGYAFCGELEQGEPEADRQVVALLVGTGYDIRLLEGETVVGRDPALRSMIDDPSVSRKHATVTCSGGTIVLRDLGSKNGTFVGGERVTVDRELSDGDVVTFGSVRLTLRKVSDASTITLGGPRERA